MDSDADKYCFISKGKKICIPKDNGEKTSFDAAKEHVTDSLERTRKGMPYRLSKTCHVQGRECFKRNMSNAGAFIILFLVASLIMNCLHELVHYSFMVMIGMTNIQFSFSANLGMTSGNLPSFTDPTIPWYWWFFEMMGPMLIVNLPLVILPVAVLKHWDPSPAFDERTSAQAMAWLRKNFLKAISYVSAFTILANTIISPFYSIAFGIFGSSRPLSDTEVFWQATLAMGEPWGMISRIIYILVVSCMILIMFLYIMLYNRRETGS